MPAYDPYQNAYSPEKYSMLKGLSGAPEPQANPDANPMSGAVQGGTAGAAVGGPYGAAIGAAAGLVGGLAQQNQQRQLQKIQNELLRRKNLQATIQQGSTGIQEAQQQNLQNLARAFLR